MIDRDSRIFSSLYPQLLAQDDLDFKLKNEIFQWRWIVSFQQLSIPSVHNNGHTSFKFSVSSTVDMEGPGGSFECVQQSGPPRGSLELLGAIPHKIRIHANDDVYETTRHRMTVAEENHKNKWYVKWGRRPIKII